MLMAEDNKVLHKVLDKVFFTPSPATEAAVSRCSSKQVFLNIRNIQKKTPALEYLFNKVTGL